MTEAEHIINASRELNRSALNLKVLLCKLDISDADVSQDWNEGATTWEFEDRSKILISGLEVHLYDVIPNTDEIGWQFAGYMRTL